jgi:hypothetical protein
MHNSPITRNPPASPALLAALERLRPCNGPRLIEALLRRGRVTDAAAIAELLVIKADRP